MARVSFLSPCMYSAARAVRHGHEQSFSKLQLCCLFLAPSPGNEWSRSFLKAPRNDAEIVLVEVEASSQSEEKGPLANLAQGELPVETA